MGTTVNGSDEKPDVMMVEKVINDDIEGNPVKAPQVYHIDGFSVLGLSAEDAEFYQNYSAVDRKKTMHKVRSKIHNSGIETSTDHYAQTGRRQAHSNASRTLPHRPPRPQQHR